MSGFGWDDGRKLVIATDEQWAELAWVCLRINPLDFTLTPPVTEGPTDQKVEDNTIPPL